MQHDPDHRDPNPFEDDDTDDSAWEEFAPDEMEAPTSARGPSTPASGDYGSGYGEFDYSETSGGRRSTQTSFGSGGYGSGGYGHYGQHNPQPSLPQLPRLLSGKTGSWTKIKVQTQEPDGTILSLGTLPADATEYHLVERNRGEPGVFIVQGVDDFGEEVAGTITKVPISPKHPAIAYYQQKHAAPQQANGSMGNGFPMHPGMMSSPDPFGFVQQALQSAAEEKRAAQDAANERLNFAMGQITAAQAAKDEANREQVETVRDLLERQATLTEQSMGPIMQTMMTSIQALQQMSDMQIAKLQQQHERDMEKMRMQAELDRQRELDRAERERESERAYWQRVADKERESAEREAQRERERAKEQREMLAERARMSDQWMQAMLQARSRDDTATRLKEIGLDLKGMISQQVQGGGNQSKGTLDRILDTLPALVSVFAQGLGGGDEEEEEDPGNAYTNPVPNPFGSPPQAPGAPPPTAAPKMLPDYGPPDGWDQMLPPQKQAIIQAAQAQGYTPVGDEHGRLLGFKAAQQAPQQAAQQQAGGYQIEGGSSGQGAGQPADPNLQTAGMVIEGGPNGAQPVSGQHQAPMGHAGAGQPPAPPSSNAMTPEEVQQARTYLAGLVKELRGIPQSFWTLTLTGKLRNHEPSLRYLSMVPLVHACREAGADEKMIKVIVDGVVKLRDTVQDEEIKTALQQVRIE